MNIDELKIAMKNGPVSFKYKKADGTVREALGTLKPELIPPTSKTCKYQITDIEWVNSDLSSTFPTDLKLPVVESTLAENETEYDYIADYLTENYGPHLGFQMHEIEKPAVTLNPNICRYYDLIEGHAGWRSFAIENLIKE